MSSRVQLLCVLVIFSVDVVLSVPIELCHSSDFEPHASPGLPECERRNP